MSKNTRNTETKQFIRWAIAKLLEQHSFEEISVTMICREAAINRGTFYLHYLDKYDMMDKLNLFSYLCYHFRRYKSINKRSYFSCSPIYSWRFWFYLCYCLIYVCQSSKVNPWVYQLYFRWDFKFWWLD